MLQTQPPPDLSRALEQLPLIYFHQGYDSGYGQAVADLRESLARVADDFIARSNGQADELRRLIYAFESFLEARISQMTPDHDYVEGGLGI